MAKKEHMKVKVLDILGKDSDEIEEELNEALQELAGYYVVDIKALPPVHQRSLVAILYLSKKKKRKYNQEDDEEDQS